jgi:hypothetical protein
MLTGLTLNPQWIVYIARLSAEERRRSQGEKRHGESCAEDC